MAPRISILHPTLLSHFGVQCTAVIPPKKSKGEKATSSNEKMHVHVASGVSNPQDCQIVWKAVKSGDTKLKVKTFSGTVHLWYRDNSPECTNR